MEGAEARGIHGRKKIKPGVRTRFLAVSPGYTEAEAAREAAAVILDGGIAAYPTETVYGLGADATNPAAVRALYEVKGREPGKPTSVLAATAGEALALAEDPGPAAVRLAERFWPGPLTIVFRARGGVCREIAGPGGTIGVRVPGSGFCLLLLAGTGRPVTAPSANPAGEPPARTGRQALEYFSGLIDLVVEAGESPSETPSTVVDATGSRPVVIRPGVIPAADIESAAGEE